MSVSTATRSEIRRGFVAIMPLWLGVVPFALAFAIVARGSGLSILDTQALSVLVFAGSSQLAFVDEVKNQATSIAILATVLLLNLRHVLYGMSIGAFMPNKTEPPKAVLAAGLTDESYGLTLRAYLSGRGSPGFLFGANSGLFVAYTTATFAGALLAHQIGDPDRLHLDVVFPLTFLALLVGLLRDRIDLAVAAFGAALALSLRDVFDGGIVVLISTVVAALLGTIWLGRTSGVSPP